MKINLKNINKKKTIITFIIIFIFVAILIACSHRENYKELTIIYDNNFIELKNIPIVEKNEIIYFSKDDIFELFDKNIYYNEIDEQLITTYNKHIAVLQKGEKTAEINDEKIDILGELKEIDNNIYLPISDLANVYDLEIKFSQKSNRIIMDSLNHEKTESYVKQRTSLRNGKGIFSKRIETLIIGDKLVVIESNGNYKKVRSPLGNIGYVKVSKLSEEEKIRETYIDSVLSLNPYFNYSNASGIYDDIEVDSNKRNVVLPEFFVLEKDDKLLDKTNINTAIFSIYKNWAERNSLEMLPTITNSVPISDSLVTYSQRSKIINELKKKVVEYHFWGININFKTIDDFNSFYRFIIELTPRFKAEDVKVIVTINNNNIERNKIDKIVDCIIEE